MGLENAFSGADADPGKRKVREVEGGPLPAAEHRQHCLARGDWRSSGRPCLIKALDAGELLAEFERALIAERVKAGLARAKAQGKHVGRLRVPTHKEAAIRHALLAGRSLRSTIKAHGVGSKTVQRIKAELADQASV
jgi:hypothetical protein